VSNGGGGGSADTCATTDGSNWYGTALGTSNPAAGGNCAPNVGGNGGAGTTLGGATPAANANGGSGGGGGVGLILVNVASGAMPTLAHVSPAARVSSVCGTSNGMAPPTCAYP